MLNAISGASSVGAANRDGQRIADDFDTFLTLLTTQLRNQNPLDPLDTHQFTQQLVEFSGVEQAIRTNQNLEQLILVSAASAATAAASFIGKHVSVQSTRSVLEDGEARWGFHVESEAPVANFTVRDDANRIVWSEQRSLPPGRGDFVWNGRTNDGGFASDGTYTLTVEAKDADGGTVRAIVDVSARVDGIDFSGAEPMLLAAGRQLPLSELRSVSER